MNARVFARALEALRQKLAQLAARCTLKLYRLEDGVPRVQVGVLHGETTEAELLQSYGFQSRPKSDAQGFLYFVGGDRAHALALVLGDRRYTLELEEGEVAVADDLGQKVHLTRDGVVVDAGSNPLVLKSSVKVRVEAPLLETTGDVKSEGDVEADGDVSDKSGTAQTMAEMRETFDAHTHVSIATFSVGGTPVHVGPPDPPPMG